MALTTEKFRLCLLGAPRLTTPDGVDVTPRMVKTQALLAYLAVARGRPVNRAALQDLLWSDRGPKQGRDSLRKALSELRRCFEAIEPNPVETTGGPVRLRPEVLAVDVFDDAAAVGDRLYRPEFLQGIEVRDSEFNRWLVDMRIGLSEERVPARGAERDAPAASPLFELGILPIEAKDGAAQAIASTVVVQFAKLAQQSAVIRLYDLRHQTGAADGDRTPDVLMSIEAHSTGRILSLSLTIRHVVRSRIIWCASESLSLDDLDAEAIASRVSGWFDQACDRLAHYDGFATDEHAVARRVFSAIDHIFRLTNCDLDAAGKTLDEASELVESSTIYAWSAFLSAFRVEKLGRTSCPGLLDRAQFLARRALELDRTNPLSAALVAHVYGFVLRDLDAAAELLAPLRQSPMSSPMVADSLAMLCFYRGEYDSAHRYATEAAALGRFNPFRYSFTTSVAMSNLMLGRPLPAVHAARQALAQHPVRGGHLYEPTLRTLAAAAGLAGDVDRGRLALRTLEAQGAFIPLASGFSPDDAPYPNSEVLRVVRSGMEQLDA